VAFTVATRDPDTELSVGLVVIGSSLAVAALAALAFVSIATRRTKRGARRGLAVARGLRRGVMVGDLSRQRCKRFALQIERLEFRELPQN